MFYALKQKLETLFTHSDDHGDEPRDLRLVGLVNESRSAQERLSL